MKLSTIKPDIQGFRNLYRSSIDLEEHAKATPGTFYATTCDNANLLLDHIEALERQIAAKDATIDRLIDVCQDNDVRCAECDGDLSRSEMEEGCCLTCSRLLS